MASWDPVPEQSNQERFEAKFKKSLVKRAHQRTGTKIGDKWLIDGDPKLGDSYREYYVSLDTETYRYQCSCGTHQGGQYRKMCSHSLYVMLAKRGWIEYDEEEPPPSSTGAPDDENHVTYPLREFPPYIEGSGASIEESREALNAEFCGAIEIRPLPEWVEYLRDTQVDAIQQVLDMYAEGKKVVFLDAPTGAGKTLIGEGVRRKLSPAKTVYTCSTLTLQDQFLEDFDYADVIKGRSNYPTMDKPKNFPLINASHCTSSGRAGDNCKLCSEPDMCPYIVARNVAFTSRLAVANIAYLLTMANYQNKFTDQPFIIIDEADVLEQQLLSFISLNITARKMEAWGMKPPVLKTKMDSWVEWVRDEAFPKVTQRYWALQDTPGWRNDPKLKKEWMEIGSMLGKLRDLGGWDDELGDWGEDHGMEGWVYMDYEQGNVTFKPINVAEYAPELLWKHSSKWLLMSATIISAQQMADDLGLEDDDWGVVTVPSDFPIESRPIYVQPVANMTWKEKDVAWPAMAKAISSIAEYHQDERILVHTVSYQLSEYLKNSVREKGRLHTYRNSRDRQRSLEKWLRSSDGIMLAPSFDRGVDLKDDLCRVVVVAKIPYPNLKDKQVNGRLYSSGGQGWYSMLTIRSVVQMTGRAMRSKTDSCEVYMLDRQFVKNLMGKNRKMLPAWWSEALVRSGAPKERGIR